MGTVQTYKEGGRERLHLARHAGKQADMHTPSKEPYAER